MASSTSPLLKSLFSIGTINAITGGQKGGSKRAGSVRIITEINKEFAEITVVEGWLETRRVRPSSPLLSSCNLASLVLMISLT